jgi:hypothetical protein
MKDKKIFVSAFLALSMIFCACGKDNNKTSEDSDSITDVSELYSEGAESTGFAESENPDETTTYSEPKEVPVITIKTSIHSGNNNLDIPEFQSESNISALKKINSAISNFETAYNILSESMTGEQGVQCTTYSFTNDKYVTAVIRWKQIPDDLSDGDIYSYVYDIENQSYYQLNRVFYHNGISKEDILKKFSDWYGAENEIAIVSSDVQAFRITSSDSLEYYVKAVFSNGESRLYTVCDDNIVPYSDEIMQAAEKFEKNMSLEQDIDIDSSAVHIINGTEYSEAELVSVANQKYMNAYNLISYLFWGQGEYGDEFIQADGKKYYKSIQSGLETYDDAMQKLDKLFLAPESCFSAEISSYLYKDENGGLWIATGREGMKCVSSGISAIDSVMESLVVFKTSSQMSDGSVKSNYFTLIASDDDFKCTYFSYPS